MSNWDAYDWDEDSRAVVASNGNDGVVLWTVGAHVQFELKEAGLSMLGDLGLDDAPVGLSIWEGKYLSNGRSFEGDDLGTEPKGTFRPLTDDEWVAVKAGRCPWDDSKWLLPAHRRYPKSPSCACDGALDDGCPMCTPEKRTPEHNVSVLTGHPVFSGCSCHGVDEPVEVCHCGPDDEPCTAVAKES